MSDLTEQQREALREWWDNESEGDTAGSMLANLDAVVARMIADAEQRGVDRVTAAVEAVLPSGYEAEMGILARPSAIRAALSDPAAALNRVKAEALREAEGVAMGPSRDLRDAGTCLSIANDLHDRAACIARGGVDRG